MDIAVSDTIEDLGLENLHKASGIPRRTLYRWAKENRIPGQGEALREARTKQFVEAVEKVKAEKAARQDEAA